MSIGRDSQRYCSTRAARTPAVIIVKWYTFITWRTLPRLPSSEQRMSFFKKMLRFPTRRRREMATVVKALLRIKGEASPIPGLRKWLEPIRLSRSAEWLRSPTH